MADYDGIYDHLKLYPDEPMILSVIKGILGAVIGALPGFGLWLLLARLNVVSSYCGALIAFGSALAYMFMTKKRELPFAVGVITCIVVLAAAVFLAERIDISWELMNNFEENVYPEFAAYCENEGLTLSETNSLYRQAMREELGFAEPTFGNCFKNVEFLVDYYDIKFDYYLNLGQSMIFGIVGGVFGLTKLRK